LPASSPRKSKKGFKGSRVRGFEQKFLCESQYLALQTPKNLVSTFSQKLSLLIIPKKVYIAPVNQSILENLILFEFLGFLFGSGYAGLGIGASNNVD